VISLTHEKKKKKKEERRKKKKKKRKKGTKEPGNERIEENQRESKK
jgi:hypothetical protein